MRDAGCGMRMNASVVSCEDCSELLIASPGSSPLVVGVTDKEALHVPIRRSHWMQVCIIHGGGGERGPSGPSGPSGMLQDYTVQTAVGVIVMKLNCIHLTVLWRRTARRHGQWVSIKLRCRSTRIIFAAWNCGSAPAPGQTD